MARLMHRRRMRVSRGVETRWRATDLEQLLQVVELPVNVTADLHTMISTDRAH